LNAAFTITIPDFLSPVHLAPFQSTCTFCTISLHLYILHHFTSPVHLAPFHFTCTSYTIHFTCTSCTISLHLYVLHHFTSPVHLAPLRIKLPKLMQCFICSVRFWSIMIWIADGCLQILITLVTPIIIDIPERLLPSVSPPITFRCTLHTSQTNISTLTASSPFSQSTNHISLYPPHISDPHCPLNSPFTLQSVHKSHFAVPSTNLRPTLPP